jgi:hypothetical protein
MIGRNFQLGKHQNTTEQKCHILSKQEVRKSTRGSLVIHVQVVTSTKSFDGSAVSFNESRKMVWNVAYVQRKRIL